jgi:hypothetical protein
MRDLFVNERTFYDCFAGIFSCFFIKFIIAPLEKQKLHMANGTSSHGADNLVISQPPTLETLEAKIVVLFPSFRTIKTSKIFSQYVHEIPIEPP